ncbi:MAG: PAS domain S-box protein [Imperialibacter sp.]|uniref:PAS domain-containing sensor histidine kinase n=1 Tax=Imperialibacter sp. TaxID=2038411 RepID=UPI003A8A8A70
MQASTRYGPLQSLASAIEEVVIVCDLEGKIVFINQAGEQLLKYSPGELTGKTIDTITPSECTEKEIGLVKQILNGRSVKKFASKKIAKNSQEVEVTSTLHPYTDEKGVIAGIIEIFQPVVHHNSLGQLTEFLTALPYATIILGGNSRILLVNRRAETLFGFSKNELTGKHPNFLLANDLTAEQQTLFGTGDKSPAPKSIEAIGKKKEEETFPIKIIFSPLSFGQDKLVLASVHDLTSAKRVASDLLKKNKLLTTAEQVVMMGHWQWDLISNDVVWSENLFPMFGHDKDVPLTYATYFGYVHDDDKDYVTERVQESLREKKFKGFFHRIITSGGEVKMIHLLGEIYTNENNDPIEMVGTCQDVTEQKAFEVKLAESETKFKSLLESAPDAMVIVNTSGQIILINAQTEKLFGYKKAELYGKSVGILFPERFKADNPISNSSFGNKAKPILAGAEKELFAIRKNQSEFAVEISLSPLTLEDGPVVSAVIRDITERKKIAKTLERQNVQLVDFCNIVSHNLRGPMINISMLVDIIENNKHIDRRKEALKRLKPVVHHLNEVFNELVESVQVRNDVDIEQSEIHIKSSFSRVLVGFRNQIDDCGAIVNTDFDSAPVIKFPQKYIDSIFSNFISNSLKYRSPDRRPEINVRTDNSGNSVLLAFTDNGLGIDLKRHQQNLFKIRKVFHKHPEAKGFGLYMTKTQVEAMGGKIWADSHPGKGTTFYVKFVNQLL